MKAPEILLQYADALEQKTRETFPALAPLAKQCYLNTIETTVKSCENGDHFVITGDIPALWLRDSAAQLRPYVPLCPQSDELCEIIRGVIHRHAFYVGLDPYSNAFNEAPSARGHLRDKTDFISPWIWERKYEVDSLCASVYLAVDYYDATKDRAIFDEPLHGMLTKILETFVREQRHAERSAYFFHRENCPETDTLPHEGKGNPVAFTGMTWSGFRPSDDRCFYNYLIPANLMCVEAMKKAARLLRDGWDDEATAMGCETLAQEVLAGVRAYGIFDHPRFGKMYAYEVDGLGNRVLMDDANSPSLLALPYLGCCVKDDPVYLNTRRFILSEENPFFFRGTAACGIGSPHTGQDKIWHISLIMQILTAVSEEEKRTCLKMLSETHAGTNYMHESFHKDNPSNFTRSWFAWANALFAQMLASL